MTDKILQRRVEDALDWEPCVDAAHVGVTAKDGVVTLSGFVGSYADKIAAENATRGVKGVQAIAQEIEVRLPSDQKRSDDEIARRMLDILLWDVTVPDGAVTVKVEHGLVTLGGEVRWQFQRARAEDLAHRLGGVLGVTNHVRLHTAAESQDMLRKIESALHRSAALDADQITVEVDGGKVTLAGTAHSWAACLVAEGAVWAASGVTEVVDRIVVSSQHRRPGSPGQNRWVEPGPTGSCN